MRQTLQSLFGFDLPTAQKWVIAFGVILVLLVLLGLFARQIKDGRLRIKGQGGGRTRQPRLGVVDIHDLDRQRQLVLIRRDNVEHLVMIGGASDVVVETNIVRSGARAAMPAQPDPALPDRPLPFDTLVPHEPARQEPVRQEPTRHEPAEDSRRAPPPAPVALAPSGVEPPQLPTRAVPRPVQTLTQAEAAVAAAAAGGSAILAGSALSRAQASPSSPSPTAQAPNFTRDHAPAPAASAGELDDMARQLDEALKRPFSAVRSSHAPASVPPEPEVVVPAAEPVAPRVEPSEEAAPAAILSPAVPPAPTGAGPRVVPADVEAELEMALGLKPERTGPRPPLFPPASFAPPKPFEPVPAARQAGGRTGGERRPGGTGCGGARTGRACTGAGAGAGNEADRPVLGRCDRGRVRPSARPRSQTAVLTGRSTGFAPARHSDAAKPVAAGRSPVLALQGPIV
jgi:flagellar protein FliO/FliZ